MDKVLKFHWNANYVEVKVDVDKTSLLDIVIEYEELAKKQGVKLNYAYPTFAYAFNMKHHLLETDKDLITMSERFAEKSVISIWVGTMLKPSSFYKLVLNLKRRQENNKRMAGGSEKEAGHEESQRLPSLEDLEDTSLNIRQQVKKNVEITEPIATQTTTTTAKKSTKQRPPPRKKITNPNLPPAPISPQTAFKSLPIRKSPRFIPPKNTTSSELNHPPLKETMFGRKIPRTTAKRKGIIVPTATAPKVNIKATTESSAIGKRSAKKKMTFVEEEFDMNDGGAESDNDVKFKGNIPSDENEEINSLPEIIDNWKPSEWYDFVDDEDDNEYYQRLYKNGELYEEKEFSKIELKPWMIFLDKGHFKEKLKDYCVQEGFAINVLWTDKNRYTATCYASCCKWRIHSSRLSDGITWAIKKIEPNVHTCRGLETYNPLCDVKWAASKLLEDIRANPDIPGNALNELLFQRYGVYMKKSSLYNMKKLAIEKLFGGHDESYSELPAYTRVIYESNPDSRAYFSTVESESIPRQLLFKNIFISFTAMWKGFLAGCRPLIGVDGTHLKGDYGGILLSAVALDANNEIFPLAYAIVSVEDKENWSWFFWNLYNLLKESSRKDWTVISDRQKGIDLALMDVWPTVNRRYCCKHISRNYKKQFSGPLMYILFWRVCNATSQFTFRKAMERLKEAGGEKFMTWFAQLGDSSTWSKHKFDPNVCNDSNTSNFVESFNSTLGIDRCRPILTLLEGIRRVCMVRIATRSQTAMTWNDDDLCPKIKKLLKDISKDTISCKAYMSKPGEYEIHEGKSHFPLSLNNKVCSCGAWQISGIPCRHAIRAMVHAKIDPHNVVSTWYSVRTYKHSYSFNINPIPDTNQWPKYDDLPTVMPPIMKRGVGRPSRNRKREEGENQKGKRAKTIKCSKCDCLGHNARTCKGGLTAKEKKAEGTKPMVVRHPRIRDQSNAAKAAKATTKEAAAKATEINVSQFPASQSQPQS